MAEVKTYQTVKLPLSVWQIVAATMDMEQVDFSEACARLIRHGSVRLNKLRESVGPEVGVG